MSTKELDAPQAFPEIAVPVTAVPRKRWHTVARRVLMSLLLTVTVVFIVLALRGQDWSTVAGTLRGQRPGFVLTMTTLAVLANAAGLVATMVSWRAMLAGVGERVPAVDAARIFYFGQLVKYVPGKVMGFLVSVEMGRAIGVPAGRMSAAWLLALVVSLLTGATVGLAAGPEVFGASSGWLLLALLPVAAALIRPLAVAMGAPPLRALPLCLGAFGLGAVAGVIAVFAPDGIGVREVVVTAALSVILPIPVAGVVALVSRVVVTLSELATAGVGLLVAAAIIRRRPAAAVPTVPTVTVATVPEHPNAGQPVPKKSPRIWPQANH
ncbi:lysylphosphatidylglycerol synthase domain-containing protein [Verrucosispora sioxanthis]|uniref:lysylphosphatidylglycerol synthase domain-containing protein n=1 Tax=Verrucosispora sioxanthis TaxID=2499994 RepID=UPI001C0FC057|nr:lysylphosphatidylglycerol synthase domain-containing protein [Verrucosispora sioxanthis]